MLHNVPGHMLRTSRCFIYGQGAPLMSDVVTLATHLFFGRVHILRQLLILIFQQNFYRVIFWLRI